MVVLGQRPSGALSLTRTLREWGRGGGWVVQARRPLGGAPSRYGHRYPPSRDGCEEAGPSTTLLSPHAPVPVGVPDAAAGSRSRPGRRLGRARVCIPATSRLPYSNRREENSGRATRQTTGGQLKRLPESHAANRATRRRDARDTLPLPTVGSPAPFLPPPPTNQETRPRGATCRWSQGSRRRCQPFSGCDPGGRNQALGLYELKKTSGLAFALDLKFLCFHL